MASQLSMPSTIVEADDNTAPEPSPSLDSRAIAEASIDTTPLVSPSLDRHSIAEGDIDANLNPSSSPFVDSTLDTFTLFPKLPLEIQLNIWKMSLPGPRVIKVKVFAANSLYDPNYTKELESTDTSPQDCPEYYLLHSPAQRRIEIQKATQNLVLSTSVKSPGSLFACHNSRSEALKKYTRCAQLQSGRETRFDPIEDTVLISHTASFALPPLPYMTADANHCPDYGSRFSGIQNLAISYFDFMVGGDRDMQALLSQFQSLKSLVLLLNDPQLPETGSYVQSDDDLLFRSFQGEYPAIIQQALGRLQRKLEAAKNEWKAYLTKNSNTSQSSLMDVEFTFGYIPSSDLLY
ncbi:hypothetical protein L207DRAFT_639397 [Hyaloscypha variabilis F]|uniref:2EXR domain-containing protein n=1 Tax=Hyaloscypha variabilis (strain UAMH 11265 / GT02V1 / F) TaxID=1149755 RepID=A0A2J6R413_HYAVF|nr:hypothetical protein L207DRAFT_639397 [Hyaloscypha variabilis F]